MNERASAALRDKPITIVVADDHDMVRRGLVATLSDEPDFQVVDEAATGTQALESARTFHPDVLIMDVNMPECGLMTASNIKLVCPETRIVVFSFWNDPEIVEGFKGAGASAYIVKGSSGRALTELLRAVSAGGPFRLVDDAPLGRD